MQAMLAFLDCRRLSHEVRGDVCRVVLALRIR